MIGEGQVGASFVWLYNIIGADSAKEFVTEEGGRGDTS